LLMTTDNQPVRVGLAAALVLITLAAAAALVPVYGFEGAIAAHAIARITILVASLVVVSRVLKVALPVVELLRITTVALLGLALVAPILVVSSGIGGQFIAGSVYAAVCLAGSVLLRLWTTADVRTLTPLVERFPSLRSLHRLMGKRARHAPGE
jgi:O-antigen/teichoic acid export membrane protein